MPSMITVRIAEVAKKRGINTAYRLHKELDVPPAMAAKLWKGEFKMIGLDTLDRLCILLKCKPNQILLHESPDEP